MHLSEHEKQFECVYHTYQDMWEASVVQTLLYLIEPWNSYKRYALAIEKNGTVMTSQFAIDASLEEVGL